MKLINVHISILMKQFRPFRLRPQSRPRAFTLLEMTLVIMVLLALISVGMYSGSAIKTWRLGRQASESLRSVYTAQKLYLADNPTVPVTSLTPALLIPYLTNRATSMPTVTSLTGATLTIKVTVFPPVVDSGSGVAYDPSGSPTDSLWDVGE
jgi:type II secretory pathway pseudopilin PulG